MDPTNVQNTQQSASTPQGAGISQPENDSSRKLRIPRVFMILVGVILIGVVGIVLLLLFGRKSENKKVVTLTPSEIEQVKKKDKSTDAMYLAQHVITWLDTQKLPDGRYSFTESCTSLSDCELTAADNRIGVFTAWARFNYYLQTKNPEDLQKTIADIDTYDNREIVPVIQNDHWNCKIMYELWSSDVFDTITKDKIQDICSISQDASLDTFAPENFASDAVVYPDIDMILAGRAQDASSTAEGRREFMRHATSVSNHVARYTWFNKDIFYTLALAHLQKSLQIYASNKKSVDEAVPLLGIAAADMYTVKNDKKFLDLAEYIFDKSRQDVCTALELCMNTSYLAKELYEITGDAKYNNYVDVVLRQLTQSDFDYKASEGYMFDKQAYYYSFANKVYPVLENSIMVSLLMR